MTRTKERMLEFKLGRRRWRPRGRIVLVVKIVRDSGRVRLVVLVAIYCIRQPSTLLMFWFPIETGPWSGWSALVAGGSRVRLSSCRRANP